MAQPLQGWTGVAKEVFLRNRLRLTKEAFLNELLRGQGVALGRSDARYSAPAADTAAGETPTDPSMDRTQHRWYAAGHMMYTDPVACRQLADDLRRFVTAEGAPP